MTTTKRRSFFRRDDAEATSKQAKTTKTLKVKQERPFEKFRTDSPHKESKESKVSKIKNAFSKDKFRGDADSYNDRVARKVKDKELTRGRTKKEGKVLVDAAKAAAKANEPMRLNRFIAQSGVCSRREADSLILQGLVTVNGEVITELGTKVTIADKIEMEGKELRGEKKVYIVMNKPKGFVTSLDDPHNERTVMDLLKGQVPQRIYPVGRLDKGTTGVLLLTNDGDLTKELTHPSYNKKKIYHVFLDKSCTEAHLEQLLEGVELEDGKIAADEISFVGGTHKEVGVELHSGRNRIVRRMFEHLGYEVVKLDRVYFAGLTKMGLRRGFWRLLDEKEVAMLKSKNYR